ncbi:nucleotidyltransferase domain-containing protein [Herbiconiux sp. VKM Ac-2851]|uniref:nucleotidyltransferase domain-containing protein n=1 Tax=Herbiconiux sp. VKM Ac-2851 TaxID=2739025 RepID=UPI00156625C8|nr:nucleotidyltransferase domain-containing protein [Herbiconiux sp. VKM Ac-2851]NQX33354.1 nucleotidyltransferase domain-containing protein [Herbiconiux sp. VKM Ac-2851]
MDLSNPGDALLGPATTRLLTHLARLNGGITGRRAAELAQVPWSTGWRTLERLTSLGLVLRQTVGSSALFTLNRDHMLWPPIRDILAARSRLELLVADLVAALADDETTAALYGSVARGDSTAGSDVDLIIVWSAAVDDPAQRDHLLRRLAEEVELATGNRLEVIDLDRSDLERLSVAADPLISSWQNDARTLVGPDLGELLARAAA